MANRDLLGVGSICPFFVRNCFAGSFRGARIYYTNCYFFVGELVQRAKSCGRGAAELFR